MSCCSTQFRTASAYRKHIQRNHKDPVLSTCSQAVTEQESTSGSSGSCNPEGPDDFDCELVDPGSSSSNNSKINIAMWILKLKESHKLTQTSVDQILQHVSELCTVTVCELGEAVKSALDANNVQFNEVAGLQDLFTTFSPFSQPFNGLLTYHHQLKFYITHLKFVVSCFKVH